MNYNPYMPNQEWKILTEIQISIWILFTDKNDVLHQVSSFYC